MSVAARSLSVTGAVAHVRAGGLVAFPTETVWGLGADASREDSVAHLRRWKGRDSDKPLSVLIADPADLEGLRVQSSPGLHNLTRFLWPGPLTLVLACPLSLATGVARADGALGIRCSPHPVARALARELAAAGGGPLTATSLNRADERPAQTREAAETLCAGEGGPVLVAGQDAGGQRPSSVLDWSGSKPTLLREGAIGAVRIQEILELETS